MFVAHKLNSLADATDLARAFIGVVLQRKFSCRQRFLLYNMIYSYMHRAHDTYYLLPIIFHKIICRYSHAIEERFLTDVRTYYYYIANNKIKK
jgi:hypothetical protein